MDEKERIKRRQALFSPVPLQQALDWLERAPDDSGARTEFLHSLAMYMLDKGIELNGLEVAYGYEQRDRLIQAATSPLEQKYREWTAKYVPRGVSISMAYFVQVLGEGENEEARTWERRRGTDEQ